MDTLILLQQPHFHLGSHVTQVFCCCFSPDGSTILSGSADKTLKLWRTRDGSFSSTVSGEACLCGDIQVFKIPTLVDRYVCSFLEHEGGFPLSETIRDFYKGELDKTRSVMNQLSSKLKKHRCVSCLTQEEVLLFLQELDIPKSIIDSFTKNQVGGKALKLLSDRNLRELGMSDINHRKALLHSICNVRENGCIRVAPPPPPLLAGVCCGDGLAAWWSADEVWKWLQEQDFNFPCLKGLTGQSLIHLSDEDISQFGLPMGPALELKEKCANSLFSVQFTIAVIIKLVLTINVSLFLLFIFIVYFVV